MNNRKIEVGDLVSIKGIATTEPIFVWDKIHISGSEFIIVNLSPTATDTSRFKLLQDKEKYKLYHGFDYFLVKEYEMFRRDPLKVYEDDTGLIAKLITDRNTGSGITELVFKYYLRNGMDRVDIQNIFDSIIIPSLLNDKHCTINKEDIRSCREKALTENMFILLSNIRIHREAFLLAKQPLNFINCAENIMDEELTILDTLKNDKELLETFLELTKRGINYNKVQYSPKNTSVHKPIVHSLNPSYFKLIKPEVEKYLEMKVDSALWLKKNANEFINEDSVNTDLLFNGKLSPNFYPILFADLGESLPLENCPENYKLQFFIPIFKWMMPEIFFDNIRLTPSELKKQHIRNIQKFIAGKL